MLKCKKGGIEVKKLFILFMGFSICFLLIGCAKNSVGSSSAEIDKEFVKENAKIDLTKSEVEEVFGEEHASGTEDGVETWLYDTTKEDFDYERRLDKVAHAEIKSGEIKGQLFINFVEDKAHMYSFFYKDEDGAVHEYVLNPDETTLEIPVSQ